MKAVPGRILVVEDDASERQGIAELLTLWGYQVATAENGIDALAEIASRAHTFDLVISDLRMPRMSGLELLKAISQQLCSTHCIIISGSFVGREEMEAIRFGASSFLEKPLDAERLRAEVRHCLSI